VPRSGAWFLFSAEIAMYPWQVSWLRSGTCCCAECPSFPGFTAEWIYGRLLFVYSGGTAPGLHRTSLFSPYGHPGSATVVSRMRGHNLQLG